MADTFGPSACAKNTWGLLVDGATYASCGIQLAGSSPVAIAIADSLPAAGSQAFVLLTPGEPGLTLELLSANKVYGRGHGRASSVRGYRIAR